MDLKEESTPEEKYKRIKLSPYQHAVQYERFSPDATTAQFMDFVVNLNSPQDTLQSNAAKSPVFQPEPPQQKGSSQFIPLLSTKEILAKAQSNPNAAQIVQSILQFDTDDTSKEYLIKLAKRESDFNPKAETPSGTYKGLYQFNNDSVREVGLTMPQYLGDVNLQHMAALRYRQNNLNVLRNYLDRVGTNYKGVKITENGMAAAAHLLGAGTVIDWFEGTAKSDRAKKGFVDGNGTSIMEYFKMFEA